MNQENLKIKSFMDLFSWQEGHKLVLMVYNVTGSFPKEELFGLVNQMRRAAVSITSNLAEGFNRQSYKEKIYFYSIAQGSVAELQNQLLIAKDVGFISSESFKDSADQSVSVHKLINGLLKKSKTHTS